ncbi:hypothetical protein D3OALGA1CA_5280 [Olavius algarvensis associated proteobacterium Delta 3]|nr:hypothetical protein D3OALGB2SA_5002 [Olavius algarvensis associated proteobacterium Delta 3]CAB5164467.1 hypothetical protein D3OALGA1CA_5280 [Olavius algarvensis associated proteobacterium Delta 3]
MVFGIILAAAAETSVAGFRAPQPDRTDRPRHISDDFLFILIFGVIY